MIRFRSAALGMVSVLLLSAQATAADKSITPTSKPVTETKQGTAESLPYKKVLEVFTGDRTVAGEEVKFPQDNPGIKSLIVTMEPGEKTAWHQHHTPLYAFILEGEITVTYEGLGPRVYKQGDGFLEAMHVTHQGENTGSGPARILATFLTGDGGKPTVSEPAPK